MVARVLVVAGSDSGGGAGIQADVKTVTALGGYAMTAITALTAQNTRGVFGILPIDTEFIRQQLEVVLSDLGADVVKTGMLHSASVVSAVAGTLAMYARDVPLVVDPVMVAKGGATLLEPAARFALVEKLLPRAALITPNAPEAAALTGLPVRDVDDLAAVADRLLLLGPSAVLVKGGHLPGASVVDLLRTADGFERYFESPRLETTNTHGTGCTLASAIATGIAEGLTLEHAVERARGYVAQAIRTAPGFGKGHGPLYHAHTFRRPIEA
ncbi:MAG: bifunctional hydroxymethylpyrimidine kinase/phosphomethylpyrimidine kinase [Polyangiaceae bacterium]|nr:bifunctional hydroxymethylpyrimidine kinase/phosphomethylpyrimidine kinase [Polyangiaceae bacterium]